jgi:hypothetical protein
VRTCHLVLFTVDTTQSHSHDRRKFHGKRRTGLTMQNLKTQAVALTLDDVVGCLFVFSLFPYLGLGFLYYLGEEENKTSELVLFGFKFLLVFVGTSIPEAIVVKVFCCTQVYANFLFFFHTNRDKSAVSFVTSSGVQSAQTNFQLQEFSRSPHTSNLRSTTSFERLQHYGLS